MRKPSLIVLATVAALGLGGTAIASTGSGKKPPVKLSGEVNDEGTKRAKGGEITIEADDVFFDPTYVRAKKGQTVTVTIENTGAVQHTFTIDTQDIDETIDIGATATVEVKLPKNGKSIAVYCRFHKGSGMQGGFFSKAKKAEKADRDSDDREDDDRDADDGGGSGGLGY